jgi:hypothetical protein
VGVRSGRISLGGNETARDRICDCRAAVLEIVPRSPRPRVRRAIEPRTKLPAGVARQSLAIPHHTRKRQSHYLTVPPDCQWMLCPPPHPLVTSREPGPALHRVCDFP